MRDSGQARIYVQPWARIDWPTPLTPRSADCGDIYWSLDQALREKQHVFVDGNRLAERWADIAGAHFTLCETGFGFGINFLVSANLWRRCNPHGAILNYVAFEKAPVQPRDLQRLYAGLAPQAGIDWPSWQRHTAQLMAHYPLPSPGDHLVWLDRDICLRLVIGDVNATLTGMDNEADAWYLDGFSPGKNPDAWRNTLFVQMASASRPGATFATYSVAGDVRRGLAAAGFGISRKPGFGKKAEMLCGSVAGQWRPRAVQRGEVGIVGAGLAGLSCADALARRGIRCTLFDSRTAPLAAASCVPRLAVSPRLAARPDQGSLFSLAAFQLAIQQGDAVASGYCRFAVRAPDPSRYERIAGYFDDDFCRLLSPAEVAATTGLSTRTPALWLAAGGWCEPSRRFASITGTDRLRTANPVHQVVADDLSTRIVLANGSRHEFDAVIIAGGAASFHQTQPLGLTPVRGQSISARLDRDPIDRVISGPISLVPGGNGEVIAGATFEPGVDDPDVRASDTALLARQLRQLTGADVTVIAGYAGVRCTTRDRMPVAGRLPDWDALDQYCRGSRRSAFNGYLSRLYVCTGFGSHGATLAPLCAEHIARTISGEVDGINATWASRLDAARFA